MTGLVSIIDLKTFSCGKIDEESCWITDQTSFIERAPEKFWVEFEEPTYVSGLLFYQKESRRIKKFGIMKYFKKIFLTFLLIIYIADESSGMKQAAQLVNTNF